MLPQKLSQILRLRNAISCVFRTEFLVNKYEGKCNSYSVFKIYISSVTGRVQCTGNKGKTVTPSRELQAMRTGKYTNKMRKIYHHPELMIKMLSANRFQLYAREYGLCAFADTTPGKRPSHEEIISFRT